MTAPSAESVDTPVAPVRPPGWWFGAATGGWVLAQVVGAVVGAIVLVATGHVDDPDDIPLTLVAILQVPLWAGLLGAPVLVAARGRGLVADLGLRAKLIDPLTGLLVGVGSQFLLVPLVSIPWALLLDRDTDDLADVARDLTDKATDPVGVVLLIVIVVLGAPVVEELFFRGLVQRSLGRWLPAWGAVTVQAVAFGFTHFQLLQLPALVAFGAVLGVLAHRTGRLGPGIAAHMAFNAVTVTVLLVS